MNIVLTGYMASGKSTVAGHLAKMLGRSFFDTDSMVEKKSRMKITEIFAKFGEAHFRSLEREAVDEASQLDGIIIATGGGVVLDSNNMKNLRKNGFIINLSPTEAIIRRRLAGDSTRPLANGSDMDAIIARFEARKPFYDDCDLKIEINENTDLDFICSKIIGELRRIQ